MREILFRGKRKDNGEWIYGNLLIDDMFSDKQKWNYYIVFRNERLAKDKAMVIPSTIGQYTGLTDKNGKKIFEGDILKNEKGTIYSGSYNCEVVFRDGMFFAEGFFKFLPEEFKLCEVIGNIHDNPELLEVQE